MLDVKRRIEGAFMARARRLAVGSGTAFAVGATAGAVGNNLGNGPWSWVGFMALTVAGAGLSAWLTYRGATSSTSPASTHLGDNTVGKIMGGRSGPVIGVNYGEARGGDTTRGAK
ncbi:hypothetical protein GCM10027614_41020 [Micromonospora vulcania]